MRIAILGAGGFVGLHLVEHLVARGEHEVVGVDITEEKLGGIGGANLSFIQADISGESLLLDDVVRSADLVVDLFAYAHPLLYGTSPLDVFELNFMQHLRVVQLCMKHDARLIQYASAEVDGRRDRSGAAGDDEDDAPFGSSHHERRIYTAGTALVDRVIRVHGEAGDLDSVVIRPFNFIGSRIDYLASPGGMSGLRVFAHFMSALQSGRPLYLVGGGKVHRAFLHIEEANTAFQTILDHPDQVRNQIFDVGNPGNNATIRDLAYLMVDLFEELVGEPPSSELKEVSGEEFYGPGYVDTDRPRPDITKLRLLGWKPRHNLRRTLRDAMACYLSDVREVEALQRSIPHDTRRRDGFVDARPRLASRAVCPDGLVAR